MSLQQTYNVMCLQQKLLIQLLKDNQLKFKVSKATNLDPTARVHRRCLTLESLARAIEPQVCVAPIDIAYRRIVGPMYISTLFLLTRIARVRACVHMPLPRKRKAP